MLQMVVCVLRRPEYYVSSPAGATRRAHLGTSRAYFGTPITLVPVGTTYLALLYRVSPYCYYLLVLLVLVMVYAVKYLGRWWHLARQP